MPISATTFHQSRHLSDSEMMPPTNSCPFCGSLNRTQVHVLQTNPLVDLFKCNNCKATSASRLPTPEALNAYYDHYYSSPDFQCRVTFDDTMRFGRHLAQISGTQLKSSTIRILDFGGGDGLISVRTAEQLLKQGCEKVEITVIDYNKTVVKFEDNRITITNLDTIENLPRFRYDFVIASASLEHVPQLTEILFGLLNLLKKGGVFYARTPYNMPIIHLCKFLGLHWDFTFPAHIYDLGQDFWETLFNDKIAEGEFTILRSTPSIVETRLDKHFWRTIFAYALKAPWFIFGKRYTLVGGW